MLINVIGSNEQKIVNMSPSPLSLVSLLFLLLNGRVQSNTCSTEGFMELSLLETKTGTNNNVQTTGLAESVETRWIITDKQFSCSGSTLTEVLVGVDIRTVTGIRNQYPKIEIWKKKGGSEYKKKSSSQFLLSPNNFTTNGLYRYTLPTPLTIEAANKKNRLAVYQPPDDRSVVRFYKVTGTGQIGRVEDDEIEKDELKRRPSDGEISLQTSSILIHPITSKSISIIYSLF